MKWLIDNLRERLVQRMINLIKWEESEDFSYGICETW